MLPLDIQNQPLEFPICKICIFICFCCSFSCCLAAVVMPYPAHTAPSGCFSQLSIVHHAMSTGNGLGQRRNRLVHLVIRTLSSFSDYLGIIIFLAHGSSYTPCPHQRMWCTVIIVSACLTSELFSLRQTCVRNACGDLNKSVFGWCSKIAQNDKNACVALGADDNNPVLFLPFLTCSHTLNRPRGQRSI
jgi:hypothetical protein